MTYEIAAVKSSRVVVKMRKLKKRIMLTKTYFLDMMKTNKNVFHFYPIYKHYLNFV